MEHTHTEISRLVGLTRSQAISRIVANIDNRNPETETPLFFNKPYPNYWIQGDLDENDQQKFRVARDKEMEELRLWWVSEMLTTQSTCCRKTYNVLAQSLCFILFRGK